LQNRQAAPEQDHNQANQDGAGSDGDQPKSIPRQEVA